MPKKPRQKWKVLPDFPKYEINQYGDVRYAETKVRLSRKSQFQKNWYQLHDGEGLIRMKHQNELLATIPEFSF